MKETLLAFVVSREAIMIYAVLAVFGLSVLVKKTGVKKDYLDLVVEIYDYVEQVAPSVGLKGNAKLQLFMSEFEDQYKMHFGEPVTDDIIAIVFKKIEEMVAEQNANK